MAEQARGNYDRAAQLYAEGLRSSAESGDKANISYCLEGLALVAAARGDAEGEARLFGAAEASLEAAGGTLYPYAQDRSLHEQEIEAIRSLLDEPTLSAAWAKGGALTLNEAVEYALSGEKPALLTSHSVSHQPPTGPRPVTLTRREQEVAVVVARGLTNRQLGAELSISEHTVANHVGNTMRKRNLSSRSQLTTWVTEQRLLPQAKG